MLSFRFCSFTNTCLNHSLSWLNRTQIVTNDLDKVLAECHVAKSGMLEGQRTSAPGNWSAAWHSSIRTYQAKCPMGSLPNSTAQIPVPVPRSRTRRGDSPIGARNNLRSAIVNIISCIISSLSFSSSSFGIRYPLFPISEKSCYFKRKTYGHRNMHGNFYRSPVDTEELMT